MKKFFPLVLILFFILTASVFFSCSRLKSSDLNLLLITIDTTRADHIGCYGYKDTETPNIDRVAAEGVRFEKAYTSIPITLPSHSSILTGTYPLYHEVRNNGTYKLDESLVTLPEVLKDKGYNTAAFIAAFPLLSRFGINQGFDVFDDRIETGREHRMFGFQERRAKDMTDVFLDWIDRRPKGKFFAWVHYYDPHSSYDPPSPFKEKYFLRPYDGEISYMDREIGRLLEGVKKAGLDENTLLVIVGDHGESLGEHNEQTHAILIYDATIRVPLIFRLPGVMPQGKVVKNMARNIDIMPTVLEYLDVTPPPTIQGTSLKPLMQGQTDAIELSCYTESLSPYENFHWLPLEGLRTQKYSLIMESPPELYDIENDPQETVNIYEQEAKVAAELTHLLDQVKRKSVNPDKLESSVKLDQETQGRLRALGYIFGASKPPEPGEELRSPAKSIHILRTFFHAQSLISMNELEEALKMMDRVIEQDPEFPRARLEKAMIMMRMEKMEEALELYNEAEKYASETAELYINRAVCYASTGQLEKAEEDIMKGLEIDPQNAGAYMTLYRVYMSQGRYAEGFQQLLKAVDYNPRSEIAHFELGRFYEMAARDLDAKNSFLMAMNCNPNFSPAAVELGKLQYKAGETDNAIESMLEALKRDPKSHQAHTMLARIYTENDHPEKGQSHIDMALAIAPNYDEAHFIQGTIYITNNRFDAAFEEFKKAAELNPFNWAAHKNLGSLYAMTGHNKQALEHYQEALKINPRQKAAPKIREAIEDLKKKLAENPSD